LTIAIALNHPLSVTETMDMSMGLARGMCMRLENEEGHAVVILGGYIAESMDISTNMALVIWKK